ncbi:hypothetical protein [Nostoc sp. 'Peltigera membranacea cyanobiont' 210A]|uniref:hypothetical protein n=1 Tax=Nostoc sp. 'Peltigera membranacea cyanobiont' 210A TaxID=2014529 RepID=UPI00167E7781|nr:hypothetical protein [Nostoc sp. 'Peltigera membranacea cyanobiont' 210A]
MNRRLYNNQSFVLTAIYRIFSDLEFSSKNLNQTVLPQPPLRRKRGACSDILI